MDDYLPKPISPKALLDKVDKWTRFDAGQHRSAGWRDKHRAVVAFYSIVNNRPSSGRPSSGCSNS